MGWNLKQIPSFGKLDDANINKAYESIPAEVSTGY
jgi:hypothetical protein